MEFFERLYRGFEAEHYVAGKLFSAGYEAFMMPGDFGFNLMVTNQKERSKGPRLRGRLLEPPFAVQVKSRRLMSSDFRSSTSGRDEAEVSISGEKGREVVGEDGCYQLREPFVAYMGNLGGENEALSFENTYFWKDI